MRNFNYFKSKLLENLNQNIINDLYILIDKAIDREFNNIKNPDELKCIRLIIDFDTNNYGYSLSKHNNEINHVLKNYQEEGNFPQPYYNVIGILNTERESLRIVFTNLNNERLVSEISYFDKVE